MQLPDEHFIRMTEYCQASDNPEANLLRAKLLGFESENLRIAPGAIVRLLRRGQIGSHCFIGLYCYVNGEVILEDHVLMGPHCSVTSNTHIFDPATQAFTKSSHSIIRIRRGTWLCAGVSVTAGTTIGMGNLLCANAVVTKDTEDFAIMAGIPARKVGEINPTTGKYHWNKSSQYAS